jgi:hypothetical protein
MDRIDRIKKGKGEEGKGKMGKGQNHIYFFLFPISPFPRFP